MKRIESVKLRGIKGERVDVVTFARWKKNIAGIEFSFALHLLPSFKVGMPNKLWISELGTGFNTLVVVKHPVTGQHMTDVWADKLGQSYVVRLAKSALHNTLKRYGDSAFVDSLVRAEMLLAKQQRQQAEEPEVKCEVCEDTGFQAEQGPEGELRAVECQACLDSKVVVTTDTDHEGQPIEARCPECVEQNGGLKGGTFQVSGTLTELYVNQGLIDGLMSRGPAAPQPDWGSPTEEEWYEGLEPANKLEYLRSKLAERQAYSKQLTVTATKADYDRIDDIDRECREIEEKLKAPVGDLLHHDGALTESDLPSLRHQREQLQLQIDQHSTMTGDTTEQEYEILTEELADIDKQIHDLENPPCSK